MQSILSVWLQIGFHNIIFCSEYYLNNDIKMKAYKYSRNILSPQDLFFSVSWNKNNPINIINCFQKEVQV